MQQDEIDRLRAMGLEVETVGQILGDPDHGQHRAARPVMPPRLEGAPAFPTPGIYFNMPDEEYHAIHALSTSGVKRLSTSSMDYWANSCLNPDRDLDENGEVQAEKKHFNFGKAIHCLVLEGEDIYNRRYVVGLDKGAYPNRLESTDDIKAAIIEQGETPVTRVETGQVVPAPTKADPDKMKAVTRAAKKDDWIEQLLRLKPDAVIWDAIVEQFRADNDPDALFVSAGTDKRVRIASRMIQAQPDISACVTGGYAEVSVFWFCPATGAPMKARFDYLKPSLIVDLKSFANRSGKPIDRAIESTIANYRYNIQQVIYVEAAMEAAKMVRERQADAVFVWVDGKATTLLPGNVEPRWAIEWAQATTSEPDFMFIFQQTGIAPVTRGKKMPTESMGVFGTTARRVEEIKRTFIANCEVYGADPWYDMQPISWIDDEAIPMWATEI